MFNCDVNGDIKILIFFEGKMSISFVCFLLFCIRFCV